MINIRKEIEKVENKFKIVKSFFKFWCLLFKNINNLKIFIKIK